MVKRNSKKAGKVNVDKNEINFNEFVNSLRQQANEVKRVYYSSAINLTDKISAVALMVYLSLATTTALILSTLLFSYITRTTIFWKLSLTILSIYLAVTILLWLLKQVFKRCLTKIN